MRQAFTVLSWAMAAVIVIMLRPNFAVAQAPATYGEALRWYEKAAQGGAPTAQYLLGYRLESGAGVPRDVAQAARWYRAAAAQGHAMAQFRLGWMRQNGHGLAQDMGKAVSWYVSAAAQGIAAAAFNLGYLYERGHGVAADRDKARLYYTQAARQGLGDAQLNLGLLLAGNRAGKTDGEARTSITEGCFWLSLAAARNVAGAAAARDAVMATLSDSEIKTVNRRLAAHTTDRPARR